MQVVTKIYISIPIWHECNAFSVVQTLLDQGARRIGVAGLSPMGCLPIVITLYGDHPLLKRDCVGYFSNIARDYNRMLQNELNGLQNQIQGSGGRIAYLDVYTPLEDMSFGRNYGELQKESGYMSFVY